jgi:hypothetical protein
MDMAHHVITVSLTGACKSGFGSEVAHAELALFSIRVSQGLKLEPDHTS